MTGGSPTKKSWRRWLRFSLRTVLVILILASIWIGWVAQRARNQKVAVEWIEGFDRQPKYDFQFDKNGKFLPGAGPIVPSWFHESVGIEHFASVEWVHLDGKDLGDIKLISNLPNLKHLELCDVNLVDISPIARLTQLDHLSISRNKVKDISVLSNLTNLKRFYAYEIEATDLSSLAGLTKLESIWMSNSAIRDISPLGNLKNLNMLWLAETQVTDISPLAGLTKLQDLDLRGNQIEDFSPLHQLTNLVKLDVSQTGISDHDFERLNKALSNCKITR